MYSTTAYLLSLIGLLLKRSVEGRGGPNDSVYLYYLETNIQNYSRFNKHDESRLDENQIKLTIPEHHNYNKKNQL